MIPKRALVRAATIAAALAAVILGLAGPTTSAAPMPQARRAARLDTTLQALVAQDVQEPQRVIIRVRPGSRAALGRTLSAHGDKLLAEHHSIDAVTAVVHGSRPGGARR